MVQGKMFKMRSVGVILTTRHQWGSGPMMQVDVGCESNAYARQVKGHISAPVSNTYFIRDSCRLEGT